MLQLLRSAATAGNALSGRVFLDLLQIAKYDLDTQLADLAISMAVMMIDSRSAEPSMTTFLLRNQPLQA